MKPPQKWKMTILVWIAIYPTITLILALFGNQLNEIHPMPLRTLVITAIVVPIMVMILMPLLQRIFIRWLEKE
jgi:antibiotic biosynthesis monooxygenase (ABM) superfamily enzyme